MCVERFDEGADVGVHKAEEEGDFGITKIVEGVRFPFIACSCQVTIQSCKGLCNTWL